MTDMSHEDLSSLPPTVDVETAARVLGCSRGLAYALIRRGDFPCRVLRLGRRYVIPTADLRRALGIASAPAPAGAQTDLT